MRTFFCALLFVFCSAATAQQIHLTDTLRQAFKADPKLTGRLDGRISVLDHRGARFQGIKLGLSYDRKVDVGISYNWLASKNYRATSDSTSGRIRFRYIAPYIQYRYIYKHRWRISLPVQIGIGRSFLQADKQKVFKGPALLYEAAMHVDYLFLRYFNVGLGVGYRLMLVNNPHIKGGFTAPTVSFHFGIDASRLWTDFSGILAH